MSEATKTWAGDQRMLEVGSHCGVSSCGKLDFLPFTCSRCTGVYCIDHRNTAKHSCSNPVRDHTTLQCPVCEKYLQVSVGENADNVVNSHISRGCQGHEIQESANSKIPCALAGCEKKQFYGSFCRKCQKTFCVHHRHPPDHHCPRYLEEEARKAKQHAAGGAAAASAQSVGDKVSNALGRFRRAMGGSSSGSSSASAPAARLQRAQRAAGSGKSRVAKMGVQHASIGNKNVPQERRLYLEVSFGRGLETKKPISMFFDMQHTVGRCLDAVCSAARVRNRNHEHKSRKLVFCKLGSEEPIPFDVQIGILDPDVKQGDTLVLQYET